MSGATTMPQTAGDAVFALLSTQGTAMAETALCGTHVTLLQARTWATERAGRYSAALNRRIAGHVEDDWDGRLEFTDCTGNDAHRCIVCTDGALLSLLWLQMHP